MDGRFMGCCLGIKMEAVFSPETLAYDQNITRRNNP
jgi:hypothetical protein